MSAKKTPLDKYKYKRPDRRVQRAFGSFAELRKDEAEPRDMRHRGERDVEPGRTS